MSTRPYRLIRTSPPEVILQAERADAGLNRAPRHIRLDPPLPVGKLVAIAVTIFVSSWFAAALVSGAGQ
jgi:hypothetical protein